jgi:alginate O-acetyltransferase complex protein AlgI
MLFSSYEFILLFLPVVILVFFLIGARDRHRVAVVWLVGASFFFYAWWNPSYLGLIVGSILFNYIVGVELSRGEKNKALLVAGIAANLSLLGYYKYTNFLIDNLNHFFSTDLGNFEILLPLGISFYTFQQIAYLVDAFRGETREYNFLHYCLFVTFFPQLIAGPIVHHRELLPQFASNSIYRINWNNISVGLTIFSIGLFKKVVLADSVAVYANPVFSAADSGAALTFFEAWGGALAYTCQLYFDFSGYADMAIGASRFFGIQLPLNFNSPYKSESIIEFWRRWHITLSTFLRDYLYIALGGNKKGKVRRYVNLMATMVLGGLWHGAGWNFIIWGFLHGAYLIVNHAWRNMFTIIFKRDSNTSFFLWRGISILTTFLAVVVGWVFFRAETLDGAFFMLGAMAGLNGAVLPASLSSELSFLGNLVIFEGRYIGEFGPIKGWGLIACLLFFAWFLPNTQEIMARFTPSYQYRSINGVSRFAIQNLGLKEAIFVGIILAAALTQISGEDEFLYFNF